MINTEHSQIDKCNGEVNTCPTQSNSETITELAKAMLRVQKAITPAVKDCYNGFTKSKYATLGAVMAACRDALTEAGVWLTQSPLPASEGRPVLTLETKLVHAESGEWQSSVLVMPLPKNDPQGYGSAMTYARRYALSAMLGIVTEDDDANMACNEGANSTPLKPHNQPVLDGRSLAKPVQNATDSSETVNNENPSAGTNLPRLDGVDYQQFTAGDGKLYVVAVGQTRGKSPMLKEAGFQWDASGKRWWKYAG